MDFYINNLIRFVMTGELPPEIDERMTKLIHDMYRYEREKDLEPEMPSTRATAEDKISLPYKVSELKTFPINTK